MHLALRPDVRVENKQSQTITLRHHTPSGDSVIELDQISMGMSKALQMLVQPGADVRTVSATVVDNDGVSGMVKMHRYLTQLERVGLLQRSVWNGTGPMMTIVPTFNRVSVPAYCVGSNTNTTRSPASPVYAATQHRQFSNPRSAMPRLSSKIRRHGNL